MFPSLVKKIKHNTKACLLFFIVSTLLFLPKINTAEAATAVNKPSYIQGVGDVTITSEALANFNERTSQNNYSTKLQSTTYPKTFTDSSGQTYTAIKYGYNSAAPIDSNGIIKDAFINFTPLGASLNYAGLISNNQNGKETTVYQNIVYTKNNPDGSINHTSTDGVLVSNKLDLTGDQPVVLRSNATVLSNEALERAKQRVEESSKKTDARNSSGYVPSPESTLNCGWASTGEGFLCGIAKATFYMTIVPASWAIRASGLLFDMVFQITVVDLSNTIGKTEDTGMYIIIKEVWSIFRDLINMTFIFVLLYSAIITILRSDTSGMKKTVASVITAAVLINFSLFFTQVIIDVSNNFAVVIHNNILQQGEKISTSIMKALHMQTLLSSASEGQGNNYTKIIIISIFGAIFMLILAVVFFVISILFIVRFVTFIILMMMSPVGIGGSVVPKLQEKIGGKFWKDLLDQCFFAPVFMLFLWITLKILTSVTTLGGSELPASEGLAETFTGSGGDQTLGAFLLSFSVVIFLLIEGLKISKSMSASGASGIQKFAMKYGGANLVQSTAQRWGAAVGNAATSGLARNTIGRGAALLTEKKGFRDFASRNALGRAVFKSTQKVADAGFGDKKGFVSNEIAAAKAKEKFREDLAKPSFKEQQTINQAKEAEFQAKERAKHAETNHLANEAASTLENYQNEEAGLRTAVSNAGAEVTRLKAEFEAKKAQLEKAQSDAKTEKEKYLREAFDTSKTSSERDRAMLKAKEAELKENQAKNQAKDEISKEEKVIVEAESSEKKAKENLQELQKTLVDAFKKVNIDIDYSSVGKITEAKNKLGEKKEEAAQEYKKAGGVENLKEISAVDAKNIVEETKKAEEAQTGVLKKIEKDIREESKQRQMQYADSLSRRRVGNLWLPSRAARTAATNVRRDARKSKEQLEEDKVAAKIKKMIAEDEKKEQGGEKPKEEAKKKEGA